VGWPIYTLLLRGVETSRARTLHKGPFDRILVAQAMVEGITLLTNDKKFRSYPGPIRTV